MRATFHSLLARPLRGLPALVTSAAALALWLPASTAQARPVSDLEASEARTRPVVSTGVWPDSLAAPMLEQQIGRAHV